MSTTGPRGQVLRDESGMRLEFVRTYDDPAADVWSALTDPARLERWFGTWSGDPATGTVQVRSLEEPEGSEGQPATILECVPPHRLVVELPSPDGVWHLSVALTEDGGATTLVFTHRLAEPYAASSIGPGWHYYLDRLDAVLAERPVPDAWDDYYPVLAADYALPAG
jgi:uncharacterized protein YndB with AHSA1/START domain